jgi:hypothetical protein
MTALFWLLLALSVSPFKSKNGLAAENAALRHQLIVLQRRVRGRVQANTRARGYALIYPIAVPAICFVLGLFLMPETRQMSIWEEPEAAKA